MRLARALMRPILLAFIAAAMQFGGAHAAGEVPHIPLDVGLMIVSTTHAKGQDYEVFSSLVAADEKSVTFELRRTDPADDDTIDRAFSMMRIVEREDIASANRIIGSFHSQDPPRFPGSTSGQASKDLLASLKRGEAAPFVFGIASGPLGGLGARKYYRGTLQRVELEPVPFSVVVNGTRVSLPAIHVKGTLTVGKDSGDAEFWFLDQEDYALTLLWTFKGISSQATRIETPPAEPEAATDEIGAALESEDCRAELHGVYFDSGSAVLLPQSTAEISAVAALMTAHPDWRLVIEGHTDDIGSDEDNMVLSQDRAEAVRTALLAGGGITAERLTAQGFGETRPLESNDTLEGRARNRRVELARQCP
jgi:outer membrane protein OmpA-like peptidoglycan-associated protein